MFDRTIIFGNTASGKSWLARALGDELSQPVLELDTIRWVGDGFAQKETVVRAVAKTVAYAAADQWVIEGVYGWLVTPIVARASCLIWTDLAWDECLENLRAREISRGEAGNLADLEPWAAAYWDRKSASSYQAHKAIFDAFRGPKIRLTTRQNVTGLDTTRATGTLKT